MNRTHSVILFEPGKLPRFIANVKSLRAYKKNPHAVVDPQELPPAKLKYWERVSKNKPGYYKSAAKRAEVDAMVNNLIAARRNK
jgi:hypothetical protein